MNNRLYYYGDNLDILRKEVKDESLGNWFWHFFIGVHPRLPAADS